jgi:hypothetical protein
VLALLVVSAPLTGCADPTRSDETEEVTFERVEINASGLSHGSLAPMPGDGLVLPPALYDRAVIERPSDAQHLPSDSIIPSVNVPGGWRLAVLLGGVEPDDGLVLAPRHASFVAADVDGTFQVNVGLRGEGVQVQTWGEACRSSTPGSGDGVAVERGGNATLRFEGGSDEDCPQGAVEVAYREPLARPEPPDQPSCPERANDCSTERLIYAIVPQDGEGIELGLPVPVHEGATAGTWQANATLAPEGSVSVEETARGPVLSVQAPGPFTLAGSLHEVAEGEDRYTESYLDARWSTQEGRDGDVSLHTNTSLAHVSLVYRANSDHCSRSNGGQGVGPTGTGWIGLQGDFEASGECA